METSIRVDKADFIKTFQEKKIKLFSLLDIKKIFSIGNSNTLKHLVRRLKKDKIIAKLCRDKYLFLLSKKEVHDFEIANFLVIPSYVSLESALSYYGLLDQFPYRISSITVGKSKTIRIGEKTFCYSQIKRELFGDFVKIDDFLIASKEKAMADYLYFVNKGLRPKNILEDLRHAQ